MSDQPLAAQATEPRECDHDPRHQRCSRCCDCAECKAIREAEGAG